MANFVGTTAKEASPEELQPNLCRLGYSRSRGRRKNDEKSMGSMTTSAPPQREVDSSEQPPKIHRSAA
jgi:hypothetical protein